MDPHHLVCLFALTYRSNSYLDAWVVVDGISVVVIMVVGGFVVAAVAVVVIILSLNLGKCAGFAVGITGLSVVSYIESKSDNESISFLSLIFFLFVYH